jgi:probable F420-dependent oxidoreductase
MKIGVYTFATDDSASIVDVGRALEDYGFESLFVPEHSHIPSARTTPWPGGPELPREYSHVLDPFVALSAVAARTSRLTLGFGVCLVVQRDPITLAKQVASLDHISGGRVVLGVGGGWNREEMANHGTDPTRRWDVLRERVLALKEIWTEDEAEFHGEFVNFDPLWAWPKPTRPIPVLVGGDGRGTFDRVLDYGDGWMPLNRGNPDELERRIIALRAHLAAAGRPPVPVTIFGATLTKAAIRRYEDLDVDRLLFTLPSVDMANVTQHLDRIAQECDEHLSAGARTLETAPPSG